MASFFAELRRRNVLRAGALYVAGAWALAQGVAQLLPVFGAPDWVTRWIVIAACIGFPFWIAFAWFYEFTPQGLKRESEIAPGDSIAHSTGRKLDFWIIGILCVAVVLLLTAIFVPHRNHAAAAASTTAAATIPFKSIAVLPFANEGGDKDQQYFSDGLSEDFITALSQFAGLKVIGRNSAFQFRNTKDTAQTIGAKLGVAHLLEGSVRRQGDEVRISAELINTHDASTLWSQHYDRPYKDLFKLQDAITSAVGDALKAKLLTAPGAVVQSDRPPSGNLDAYNALLRGNAQPFTEAGQRQAIAQYTSATELDPKYALAYAAVSSTWTVLAAAFLGGTPEQHAYAQGRSAADTALRLDPDLAAAHSARAFLLLNADLDWNGALREARRAVALAPNKPGSTFLLAQVLSALGQPQQAVALQRQALAADPLNSGGYESLALDLRALGRLDAAEAAIRKAIELAPGNSRRHANLTLIKVLQGDSAAALAAARAEPRGFWHAFALAFALQIGRDRGAADAAQKSLIDKYADNGAYQIAEVYALRKDPDKMFEWLDRAWTNRDPGLQYLLIDPFILRYQHDPRFAAFCKKVGLPTTTTAKAMP